MIDLNKIEKAVYKLDIAKGMSYNSRLIELRENYTLRLNQVYLFHVKSENSNFYYDVNIKTRDGNIVDTDCDCFQFSNYGSCKHVAACLLNYGNQMLRKKLSKEETSKEIIKLLLENNKTTHIKKQLKLEIIIYIGDFNEVELKIGDNRLYSLNNKLNKFVDVYYDREKEFVFGKELTYNKDNYYFDEIDQKIIDYVCFYKEKNPYINSKILAFNNNDFKIFLNLLKHKTFTINAIGEFNGIIEGNPLNSKLTKNGEIYTFSFDKKIFKLTKDNEYVVTDKVYKIPTKVKEIINLMKDNNIEDLVFKEEELDNFTKAVLPSVKDNIKLSDNLKDEIIIVNKPEAKIYFDFKYDKITADLILKYKDIELNYFDKNTSIVRDTEYENYIINELKNYNFSLENNSIFISDIENIGNFLEYDLLELAEKYEIYTSQKIKEIKINKNTSITSNFSIGKDNIMSYKFDLGDIKNEEISLILDSMKKKKKYFKLKNGDILSLKENKALRELDNLIDDLEINSKHLINGYGEIPKYRAIYLDSLNYNIIKTDNLFNNLINKFNSYKNINIDINDSILRDYQVTGVKWLYNIYKCGFGGILADEMGLGKSIQLIYFIKQILKENKGKILIVSPTSLIYNWGNEFNKFGSELKYKVIAETRSKREELFNNIDDYDILITTYGLIREDKDKYLDINFDVIVIDEAQNIKNPNAIMTKVIKSLKANTKIALTGTPIENNVLELWSIFDFIMPGYLTNITNFKKKYNLKDVKEEELKKLETLSKQIKPFILRRLKKNVIKELPDKIENNIYIDLNKEQKKIYLAELEKTNREMEEIIKEEGFTKAKFKILQLLTRLRQICINPQIIYENYSGGSSKIDELIKLVKEIIENGHKILLFTSYKTALDIVNKEFNKNNISTYIIDGSTSSKKRMELVTKFNEDDTNVFLIMLKAGGTGLNLTSADVVIHLDLWWNPQVENQATDRAHRIGQKNTVEVIKLICKGTIEEKILELQNKKKILSDSLIDSNRLDQNMITDLTEKDIKNLLALDNIK